VKRKIALNDRVIRQLHIITYLSFKTSKTAFDLTNSDISQKKLKKHIETNCLKNNSFPLPGVCQKSKIEETRNRKQRQAAAKPAAWHFRFSPNPKNGNGRVNGGKGRICSEAI